MSKTWIRGTGGGLRALAMGLSLSVCVATAGCLPEFGIWPADAGGDGEDADHETEPDGDIDADADGDADADAGGDEDADGDEEPDLCEGVTCSEHGVCYEIDGEARCDCDFGFDPEIECAGCYPGFIEEDDECARGRECLPSSCAYHADEDGCGINEAGEVVCTCWEGFDPETNCARCLEGYHLSGDECLEDETCPPAEEACSGRGTCDLVNGVAICTCEPGYQGDECEDCYAGYHLQEGECVRDQTCLDSTCSGHGPCELIDGVVTCDCDEGYVGDSCAECAEGYHHLGLDCVPDDSCEGRDCSGHGRCVVEDGVARCLCTDGYRGEDCEDCYAGYEDHDGTCVIPRCGDGFVDPGEECDEGEDNAFDGPCLPTCRAATCGDGEVCSDREACDDLFEYCDDAGEGEDASGIDWCADDCLEGERIIETVAGGGVCDGLPARAASLRPNGVAIADDGSIFFADVPHNRLRKFRPNGTIETVVGTGVAGFNGDHLGTETQINNPSDIAIHSSGQLYFLDTGNSRLRLLGSDGRVTSILGNGGSCWIPIRDRTLLASDVSLCFPVGLDVHPDGNVLIVEHVLGIVLLLRHGGIVERIAGTGAYLRGSPDGLLAHSTSLAYAQDAIWLPDGTIAVSEYMNPAIRHINPTGNMGTFAELPSPKRFAFRDGELYVTRWNEGVYIIPVSGGRSRNVAGGGTVLDDDIPATSANLFNVFGIDLDGSGRVVVGVYGNIQGNHRIRRFTIGGNIETIAGNGFSDYCGDIGTAEGWDVEEPPGGWDYSAINAAIYEPRYLAVLPDGTVVWGEMSNNVVRMMYTDGTIDTLAGSGRGGHVDGFGRDASLYQPNGIAVDLEGNILVPDTNSVDHNRIRRIDPETGEVATIAGIGPTGRAEEGTLAIEAPLGQPVDMAVGSDGTIYVAELDNHRIIRIDPEGLIWTYAGSPDGISGDSGDGGAATAARFMMPYGLGIDENDILYVADYGANRVRRILPGDRPGTATIEAFAGNAETTDYTGDGGPPEEAGLYHPLDVYVDEELQAIFISDSGHRVVRMVRSVEDEDRIWTVVGSGCIEYEGDDSRAIDTCISPMGIVGDGAGGLYIADSSNNRIRHAYFEGTR